MISTSLFTSIIMEPAQFNMWPFMRKGGLRISLKTVKFFHVHGAWILIFTAWNAVITLIQKTFTHGVKLIMPWMINENFHAVKWRVKIHDVKWRVKFHAVKLRVKNNILSVKYYWWDCSEISHAMIINYKSILLLFSYSVAVLAFATKRMPDRRVREICEIWSTSRRRSSNNFHSWLFKRGK